MNIKLLVVGKTTSKQMDQLILDYQNRLIHYVPFSIQVIPELKNVKALSQAEQKDREAQLILAQLQPSDQVVLLDEHGKEYRSIEFADQMQRWMSAGHKQLVFVVGGPYGFAQSVYQRANGKISLSQMTFSHQMIRLIFVEQIYRAHTILRGEPYHHE